MISVGKFFNKLFTRQQKPPVKVERKVAPQSEKMFEANEKKGHISTIEGHNQKQARKASKVAKRRKANKLARKQRKLNAKGGIS